MTRLISWLSIILTLSFCPAPGAAQAPTPIRDGFVTEGFVGWEKVTSGLPGGVKYLHRPTDAALKRSAVWLYENPTSNTRAAFLASAKAMGIAEVRILATAPMKKAVLLDADGSGDVFIASGVRFNRPFRIAALVVYGSLDESPKSSGVHMFAAREDLYTAMGGWTVPASLFLHLDPQADVASANEQGHAPPALQAKRLAGVADIWAQWVLETYIQMAQSNIRALDTARKSMVCAGDPNCILVPVD